jgi:hypothetical protein
VPRTILNLADPVSQTGASAESVSQALNFTLNLLDPLGSNINSIPGGHPIYELGFRFVWTKFTFEPLNHLFKMPDKGLPHFRVSNHARMVSRPLSPFKPGYISNMHQITWILDADISRFFDSLSREWLIRFIEHRIGDRRIIRLIQKWMKAGV